MLAHEILSVFQHATVYRGFLLLRLYLGFSMTYFCCYINCGFDKLITALRTAVDNDGVLDKEATSYNDIFDAFRLALKFYHFRDRSEYD